MQPGRRSAHDKEPVQTSQPIQEINCQDIREAGFVLGKKLGEGRFSEVVLGKHTASGKEFAVKVVDQAALEEDEEASAALHIEVEVLQRAARHPHVVALRSVIRTPAATYLVMDLMRGGELFDAIINRGSFPEEEARLLLKQLLSALAYCHALGVVHRDLKPENVLFEEDEATRADGAVGSLKLIDFGYAALHKPGERLRGLSGTPDYVAPEVLSWYEGDDQAGDGGGGGVEYDASCDMWSIGVILFILLCGFPPFYAEAEPELIQKVREGQFEFTSPYWDDISASAKDLISRCLALHPEDRPTPTEALRHPWVGGVAAAAQPAQEQEPIAAPASAPPRGSDAQRAPVPPASLPPAYDEPAPQEDEAEDDDYFDDQSDASPPPREPEPRVEPRKHKQQSPPLRNVPTRGGGGSAAAPAPSAPTMSASSDAAASMKPGELISRIRRMRQSYAPGHPMQARSGADGAPGLQLTMDGSGPPQVQAAPTREALEAQGATFVKVPRSLFQDIYALVEAQRRGELPEAGEHPLSEVLQALSAQVQRGDLGTQLGRDAKQRTDSGMGA